MVEHTEKNYKNLVLDIRNPDDVWDDAHPNYPDISGREVSVKEAMEFAKEL